MLDVDPEPPEPPPPAAAPIAKTKPRIAIPFEPSVTSTPGGKYKKGTPQPRSSDLISFGLGSLSNGLPKSLYLSKLSFLSKVPFLFRRHLLLFLFYRRH